MSEERLKRALKEFEPPFKYDSMGQMIWSANGHRVIDIRGWGHLGYIENAEAVQDAFGEFVAEAMNHFTRPATSEGEKTNTTHFAYPYCGKHGAPLKYCTNAAGSQPYYACVDCQRETSSLKP